MQRIQLKAHKALSFNVFEHILPYVSIFFVSPCAVTPFSEVITSGRLNMTGQHNNRGEFYISFGEYGLPFLLTIFMKVHSISLLLRRGYSKPLRLRAWDIDPIYFPLTFFLHYVVCCASSLSPLPVHSFKSLNGTAL